MPIKRIIMAVLALALFTSANMAEAGAPVVINIPSNPVVPMPVTWSQDNINIPQLLNIFSQNPNTQQFDIQFPNGMSWDVTPAQVQALYSQYSQKAAALGLGQSPDLSFSSLGETALNSNAATIPISNAMNVMQQESDAALNELQAKGSDFWYSLPDWMRSILEMIATGFTILFDFARDEVQSFFR